MTYSWRLITALLLGITGPVIAAEGASAQDGASRSSVAQESVNQNTVTQKAATQQAVAQNASPVAVTHPDPGSAPDSTDTDSASPLDEWIVDVLPRPVTASGELNIQPFQARYSAIYNGKPTGQANISLMREGADFAMAYRMKATRGLASFVGANLNEEGRFRFVDGELQPIAFRHKSKAFLSKTVWHADFDISAGSVSGEYEGDAYTLGLEESLHDPLTQFIYSAEQSLLGVEQWDQSAVVKGEARPYHFERDPLLPLATQCAELQAWRVVRSRDTSSATQEVWYSPGTGVVPVRIRNTQRDGDVLDLNLVSLEVNGQRFCGVAVAESE